MISPLQHTSFFLEANAILWGERQNVDENLMGNHSSNEGGKEELSLKHVYRCAIYQLAVHVVRLNKSGRVPYFIFSSHGSLLSGLSHLG